MLHPQYYVELDKYNRLIERKNQKSTFYNGVFDRYEYPVLTREHIPLPGNMIWIRRPIHTLWSGWVSMQS